MLVTFYAGAADAAGTTTSQLEADDLTAAQLLDRLGGTDPRLADVLTQCSLLVDGRPVRDAAEVIPGTARVDVLPPFAGG